MVETLQNRARGYCPLNHRTMIFYLDGIITQVTNDWLKKNYDIFAIERILHMKNDEVISIYDVLRYEQTKKLCDVRGIHIFLLAGRLDKLGR